MYLFEKGIGLLVSQMNIFFHRKQIRLLEQNVWIFLINPCFRHSIPVLFICQKVAFVCQNTSSSKSSKYGFCHAEKTGNDVIMQLLNALSQPAPRFDKQGYRLRKMVTLKATWCSEKQIFEIGMKNAENTSITFFPEEFLFSQSTNMTITFSWNPYPQEIGDNLNISQRILKLKKRMRLLEFSDGFYSWAMAAKKCQQLGMVLLQLQDDFSTKETIAFITVEYTKPIFAVFVGLIRKVSKSHLQQLDSFQHQSGSLFENVQFQDQVCFPGIQPFCQSGACSCKMKATMPPTG